MGNFIEEERKRREDLAREVALDTPAKRVERERLLGVERELKRNELLAKSRAYFRESFTPRLVDELSAVIKGRVSLSDYGGFSSNLRQSFDIRERGEIWLRLDWDEESVMYSDSNIVKSELRRRFGELEPFSDSFSICKSIGVVFAPSGSIKYLNGINVTRVSSEITYQQWKSNRVVEEAYLKKVFDVPGEYLKQVRKPYFEGPPTSERAGPGF